MSTDISDTPMDEQEDYKPVSKDTVEVHKKQTLPIQKEHEPKCKMLLLEASPLLATEMYHRHAKLHRLIQLACPSIAQTINRIRKFTRSNFAYNDLEWFPNNIGHYTFTCDNRLNWRGRIKYMQSTDMKCVSVILSPQMDVFGSLEGIDSFFFMSSPYVLNLVNLFFDNPYTPRTQWGPRWKPRDDIAHSVYINEKSVCFKFKLYNTPHVMFKIQLEDGFPIRNNKDPVTPSWAQIPVRKPGLKF